MDFTDEQITRYSRHILLPEVGGKGQKKIAKSRILIVGAGGLGSPAALYLAAAGVGTIGVVDSDVVDLSNLQRQIAHATDRVGLSKVASAGRGVAGINPEVNIAEYQGRLGLDNARALIREYDVIADGSDNIPTRFLVNDACF